MTSFRLLRHTYQNITLSIGVIIFCLFGYFGGVIPVFGKIQGIFQQKQALLEEREILTNKLTILDRLNEDSLRADLTTILTAVPTDKSVPSLFRAVEGVANATGVSVSTITVAGVGNVATGSAQPGQTAVEKQIGAHVTPFVVNILGSFDNVQDFITMAPQVRRLMRIRTFALQFPKDDTPLNVSLDMDVFYEPLPTSLGAVSQPIFDLTPQEKQALLTISDYPNAGIVSDIGETPSAPVTKPNPFLP